MATFLNRATCDASHDRFVRRVIETENVWYLSGPDGVATSASHDDEETAILLFWSDRAYATRAKREEFAEYRERSMDLFDHPRLRDRDSRPPQLLRSTHPTPISVQGDAPASRPDCRAQ